MKRILDLEEKFLDETESQKKLQDLSKRYKTNLNQKDEILGNYFLKYIDDLIEIFDEEVCEIPQNDSFLKERWPSKTPTQIKIMFLSNVGILSHKSVPILIAKYIRTLEDLNSNNDGLLFFNIQSMNTNTNADVYELNLAFCWMLKPSIKLINTSFQDIPIIEYVERISTLQRQIRENKYLYRQIVGINEARLSLKPLPLLYPETSITALDDLKNEDDLEILPHQKLQEFLLAYAASKGLRKSLTAIYKEQICMPENTKTSHFKYHKDFKEWIYEVVGCAAMHRYEHYALTKNYITPKQCAEHLAITCDPRLPFLKKNRTLFSYSNGIFNAKTGRFHLYHKYTTNLSNYNIGYTSELDSEEQSANFFQVPLLIEYFQKNPYSYEKEKVLHKIFRKKQFNLFYIPAWDKILIDQEFEPKAIKWFQFSLGRLLHDVGSLDNYQMTPYVVGVGGSGKSSIFSKYSECYEKVDVGTIMDDVETTFTDQHLLDKLLVVGADVSSEIKVSTTRFNCWITGDDITVNLKHKTAISKKWTAPMCFGSNEYPGIKSKAGSGARRFLFFLFNYAIIDADTHLPKQLTEQLPQFLVKCALRYLHYVRKYKSRSLWEKKASGKTILPKMCYIARKEYVSRTSCPDAFLDNHVCTFDKSYNCSKKDLVAAYTYFLSQTPTRSQGSLYAHKSPEACTATNFAYALSMRNCKWDVTTDIIYGLRVSVSTKNADESKTDNFIPHNKVRSAPSF